MPKLPTKEALGVRPFQDRSSIVTPSLDTRGQGALVGALSSVSRQINDRLDRVSLNKAKIHFQKAKLEADNAFDQDPDFDTHQERYETMMGKAVESSAKIVRNSGARKQFEDEMSLYRAQGSEAIKDKAFTKEVKQGVSEVNETLTVGRENYLSSTNPQDRQFAREAMIGSIDNAEELGYIDAVQATARRQAVSLDLAIASIEMEPPEKQVDLLKAHKGIIKTIPADKRKKMIKSAEDQLQSEVALVKANEIRTEGGTRAERLEKVNEIDDPDIKASTRSQVISDIQQERVAIGETRFELFDSAAKEIIGGTSLNGYRVANPKAWEAMDSAQQSKLITMSIGKPRRTDLAFYHDLNMEYQKDPKEAYNTFLEGATKLSESDAKKWSDRFAKGQEADPLYSLDKEFNNRIGKTGIDLGDSAKGEASKRLHEEWAVFQKNNPGKDPNAEQQDKMMERVLGVYEDEWYSPITYNFEIERSKVMTKEVKAKSEKFDAIIELYREQLQGGSDVPVAPFTDKEISLIYRDAVSKGLIDE